jgi:hypothetical protein
MTDDQAKPMLDADGNPVMLLGRPVYFSEKAPVLGNSGDITLESPTEEDFTVRQTWMNGRCIRQKVGRIIAAMTGAPRDTAELN